MKKERPKPLTPEEEAQLAALAAMTDDEVDTSDAPEVTDWTGARRGMFFDWRPDSEPAAKAAPRERPAKEQLTLRLDPDVVAWFREHAAPGENYRSGMTRALADYVREQVRKAG